jgi:hypothetical protein
MRQIEKDMIRAIMNGRNWANSNTMVRIVGEDAEVYLHGNHIATVKDCLPIELIVNKRTLSNWPTPTTKSRLRALGADVRTSKGVTYLNGEVIA